MRVFVVYCHPSNESFTYQVKERFLEGLKDAGHEFVISDLYDMHFNGELSEEEYLREAYYKEEVQVASDVLIEQEKIQNADAIVFIYPVFWTEAPAKLVGWFDRVWSSGFAYNPNPKMKQLDKALFLAVAGKSKETLEITGEKEAMCTVMLKDRIRERALKKEMIILDSTSHWDESLRKTRILEHLDTVYNAGIHF